MQMLEGMFKRKFIILTIPGRFGDIKSIVALIHTGYILDDTVGERMRQSVIVYVYFMASKGPMFCCVFKASD